jgi:hypothetical protein
VHKDQENRSEVARLLKKIREEYEAAERGMSGLAYGTSKHEFITQKMENVGKLHEELQTIVGEMPAIALIAEQMNVSTDTNSSSVQ